MDSVELQTQIPGPTWKRVFLGIWAIAYGVTLFFGLLQTLLMSDLWWLLAPMIVVPPATYLGIRAVCRAHLHGKIAATVVMMIVATAHLVLPVRQLLLGGDAAIDAVIAAVVAALLFLAL
jgi:hypothetical protein